MTTDDRIATLESQVRTLKRMLLGCIAVALAAGVLAAQDAGNGRADKPMKVELVGPVKVDGVGAIVTHTVKWDGVGPLPVHLTGGFDGSNLGVTISGSIVNPLRIRSN
jgi:hypothetical protein